MFDPILQDCNKLEPKARWFNVLCAFGVDDCKFVDGDGLNDRLKTMGPLVPQRRRKFSLLWLLCCGTSQWFNMNCQFNGTINHLQCHLRPLNSWPCWSTFEADIGPKLHNSGDLQVRSNGWYPGQRVPRHVRLQWQVLQGRPAKGKFTGWFHHHSTTKIGQWPAENRRSPSYPLVNVYITMENHHF